MQNVFTILIIPLLSASLTPPLLFFLCSSILHFPLKSEFSGNGNCHQSRYSPNKGMSGQSIFECVSKSNTGHPVKRQLGGFKETTELGEEVFARLGSSPSSRLSYGSPSLKLSPALLRLPRLSNLAPDPANSYWGAGLRVLHRGDKSR